ncbi:MAG: hypothetical protein ACTTJ1_10525 [Treponema sp.]
MKKLVLGIVGFLFTYSVFAMTPVFNFEKTMNQDFVPARLSDNGGTIDLGGVNDSMKNFATTMSEIGSGTGFLGITFDPFGSQNLLVVANFTLLGPWNAEIGFGYSVRKTAFAFDIDILNFQWNLPFIKSNFWAVTAGVGCPFTITIGKNTNDVIGVRPSADLRVHLFASSEYGAAFIIRPGYVIDFEHKENNSFAMPVGIMFRLPGSIIADAIANAL